MGDNQKSLQENAPYLSFSYFRKRRWSSLFHQLKEVLAHEGASVLEIGPGPGVFAAVAKLFCKEIKTLDIESALKPDYVASVLEMPFDDDAFDVVTCCQMLEHIPYEDSLKGFAEICRVAKCRVVISLPNASRSDQYKITLPIIGMREFLIEKPNFLKRRSGGTHTYDGYHYWEINKSGYELAKIIEDFSKQAKGFKLEKQYRVKDNPYHHFFIYTAKAAE